MCGMKYPLRFPLVVLSEAVLFPGPNVMLPNPSLYPYAIQMSIKILAAKRIKTSYYMTLDSDCVMIQALHRHSPFADSDNDSLGPAHHINMSSLFVPNVHSIAPPAASLEGKEGDNPYYNVVPTNTLKAIYEHEHRSVHEHWWKGSERFLQFTDAELFQHFQYHQSNHPHQCGEEQLNSSRHNTQGFSVTPALLSTYGSFLVLNQLRSLYCGLDHHQSAGSDDPAEDSSCINSVVYRWLSSFGVQDSSSNKAISITVWSEYTLYRLVLDAAEVLDQSLYVICVVVEPRAAAKCYQMLLCTLCN